MPKQAREALLLVALCAIVFLTRLGATHFWDDDEAYFAETAREMLLRDDLIVPWFNQELFAHKPPFMYWMMIGAYRLFGVSEFAARFPSALFGLATVLLVWRIGRIAYSPRVGFWAGVILATSLNYVVISRAAASDAELTFFCTLPLYIFIRSTSARRMTEGALTPVWHAGQTLLNTSWHTWASLYAAMGIAVLVKGPIGVLLPTSVLGLFLLFQRARDDAAGSRPLAETPTTLPARLWSTARGFAATFHPASLLRTIWGMRPLTAMLAVLAVAGPWYVAVALKTDGEFLRGFFGVHHFGRFTNPMDNHSGPLLYYFAVVCVGFFPWIIFLSPSAIQFVRRLQAEHPWRLADLLCVSWLAVWFGFFSLASTKFPHYIIPAYPALALLTAAFVDRWLEDRSVYTAFHRRTAWGTLVLVGVGLIIALPIVGQIYLGEATIAWIIGPPLIAAGGAAWFFCERGQVQQTLNMLTWGTMAFLLAIFALAAVDIDRHQISERMGQAIRGHSSGEPSHIAAFRYYRPSLVYYCPERIETFRRPDEAAEFLRQHAQGGYLLTHEAQYEEMRSTLPADVQILARAPWFLKPGKTAVLLGRGRPMGDSVPQQTAHRTGEPAVNR